jgi:hypothetical protein
MGSHCANQTDCAKQHRYTVLGNFNAPHSDLEQAYRLVDAGPEMSWNAPVPIMLQYCAMSTNQTSAGSQTKALPIYLTTCMLS